MVTAVHKVADHLKTVWKETILIGGMALRHRWTILALPIFCLVIDCPFGIHRTWIWWHFTLTFSSVRITNAAVSSTTIFMPSSSLPRGTASLARRFRATTIQMTRLLRSQRSYSCPPRPMPLSGQHWRLWSDWSSFLFRWVWVWVQVSFCSGEFQVNLFLHLIWLKTSLSFGYVCNWSGYNKIDSGTVCWFCWNEKPLFIC